MAVKSTTWQPSTCGCIIEYDADDTRPDVFPSYKQHVFTCAVHSTMPPGLQRWDAVVDENQTFNYTKAAILEAGLPEPVITMEPNIVGKGRALRVTIPGATPQQLATARAVVARFGTGKVTVA